MANEFVHPTVGTSLTQAEYELITAHQFNSQATGDVLYASSATQLSRLGIGSAGDVLIVAGGVPSWAHILQVQTNGLTVGLAASAPEPDLDMLHVWAGTAGAVTANTSSVLIVEKNAETAISILTPNNVAGILYFGDADSNVVGGIIYSHNADTLTFRIANASKVIWDTNSMAFQQASTISTTAGALTLAPNTASLLFTGTLALTGSRVTQSYHTNITSTNAVTVDSWGESKELVEPYAGDALAVLRNTEVISFRHRLDRDASGRVKLGVRAETVAEPMALVPMDYGHGLGVGPALDTMGLAALHTRAIQQIEEILRRLTTENSVKQERS